MQRFEYLDGWRGCAISAVIVGHFFQLPYINLGRFGVELFFVLSGRLMAEILFEKVHPIGDFFKRRVIRIYPAFFVFVVLVYNFSEFLSKTELITALTFTYNYLGPGNYSSSEFHHIWSLCVEEHMYILLALLALSHRKAGVPIRPVLAFLIVAMILDGIISQEFGGMGYQETYWRSDVRGASILMGAFAYINRQMILRNLPTPSLATAGFIALSLVLNTNPIPDTLKYSVGTAALAVALATLPALMQPLRRILETTALRWLGLISFSLYLWQQPFYTLKNLGQLPRWEALAIAFGVALVSYALVESAGRKRVVGHIRVLLSRSLSSRTI